MICPSDDFEPPRSEFDKRNNIVYEIEEFIQDIYPGKKHILFIYLSFLQGLHQFRGTVLPGDVDFLIVLMMHKRY